jgi:hypothetical protein
MRIMTAFFFLSTIALVSADDAKKEETKLKGKWSAVSLKHAGREVPDDIVKNFTCTFEEKTYNNVSE